MNETDKAVESEPRNVVVSLNFIIIIIIIIFHSFFLSSFFLFCDFSTRKIRSCALYIQCFGRSQSWRK